MSTNAYFLSEDQLAMIFEKIQKMLLEGEFDRGDFEMSMTSPFQIVDRIYDLVQGNFPDMPAEWAMDFAQKRARIVIDAYWDNKRSKK